MNTPTVVPIGVALFSAAGAGHVGTPYERGRAAYLQGKRIWELSSQEEKDGWAAAAADCCDLYWRAMIAEAVS